MSQHAQNTPVCRDCDGFPVVAITTGTRASDGTRNTLRITCLTCKGTGRRTAAALVRAGR
ncbi:RNase P subunit RPR2 [Streptomyces canus]|uniref:hypothetical protein n=1 Tax=Streptomyces canus TaxID=58343 RepID=UPI0027849B9E|nr:hypothetical protein [Streptomyces canus]MDQ0600446.1 RNase P subunit RPR2 [Streptomyces canus]